MGSGSSTSSLLMVSKSFYSWTAAVSVLTCLLLGLAIGTMGWDVMTYDLTVLKALTPPSGYNVSLDNITDNYFVVTFVNGSGLWATYLVPMERYGGMWWTCDTLTASVRETMPAAWGHSQCETFVRMLQDDPVPKTDAILELSTHLARSAVSCAIVAALSVGVGCPVGIFALFQNLVITVMITGVCFLCAALYILFAAILMLLRKDQLLLYASGRPEFLLEAFRIGIGYSHVLAWISLFMCIVSGITWIILSLRIRNYRIMTMYA